MNNLSDAQPVEQWNISYDDLLRPQRAYIANVKKRMHEDQRNATQLMLNQQVMDLDDAQNADTLRSTNDDGNNFNDENVDDYI